MLATEPDEVPIFVDELHPEVVAMVEEVMANVKFDDADLPVTEIAIDTLTEAIDTAQEEKLEKMPSAARFVFIVIHIKLRHYKNYLWLGGFLSEQISL